MNIGDSPLLTDLYQLNMMQAYLANGLTGPASFELFVRRLPPGRSFMMAAGLEQAVEWLAGFRFSADELAYLEKSGRFDAAMLDYLATLRFTGDVDAMPEGTVFFPHEPILRVTAPLPLAQLLESRLINLVQLQSLVATKAARVMLAAPGKVLVDFGFRRAHGAEAGLMAARAAYVAGFAGTATVLAEMLWGIPIYGTMAHSYVQAHEDESVAFETFARARPDNLTLLIDTYDPEAAARKVVALAPKLARDGIVVRSVRLDSGDLVGLSRRVRAILDAGGCPDIRIFVSGGLEEGQIAAIVESGAPIDGYGVGTALTTSQDQPVLDIVYKLQEYDGVARRKRSAAKQTFPGRKQVWRTRAADGTIAGDVISLDGETLPGETLLAPVMRAGERVRRDPSLADIRARAARELAALPPALRDVTHPGPYPVAIGTALHDLTEEVDRRIAAHG
ncbi:nicotinate phosphoribosyltransferase [Rhodoplanes sp. TEM]|uniref:Nicotinate phosphoribosyltransferase n=1 Tax=Rhodoplanes tepidamans TaxID=200616 RepID=A0ABT5JKU5_RHOTP|nr:MULTISPECIES: nicotinate phosphoribosyltransferase [Rhodoplanes]MDC7790043.1 nicotinate phosphoribosyltransferase [Rhodoplanes tepidamans]MDC7988077.1 nicotinate phosphoribosyltransferase [Rhodoplanes sp. TEM]MDQ0354859.1 nicotinate phosphoribosyltransferase [Rhodoplanes tepidamans]